MPATILCRFLGLCLLMLPAIALQAQNDQRFIVEVSFGPSFPVGKMYKSGRPGEVFTDQRNARKTGYTSATTLGYKLNKNISAILQLGSSTYGHSKEPYIKLIRENMPDAQVAIEVDKWRVVSVRAGGRYEVPVGSDNALSFHVQATAGIALGRFPKSQITVERPGENYWTKSGAVSFEPGFSYESQLGAKFRFMPGLYGSLAIGYSNATLVNEKSIGVIIPKPFVLGPTPPVFWGKRKDEYRFGAVSIAVGMGVEL